MKGLFSALVVAVSTQSSAQGQPPQAAQPAPPPFSAQRPIYPDIRPARTCESLTGVILANTTIERAAADGPSRAGRRATRISTAARPAAGRD